MTAEDRSEYAGGGSNTVSQRRSHHPEAPPVSGWSLFPLLAAVAAMATVAAADGDAEAVLADLRAADAARIAADREVDDWERERSELEALAAALEDERARIDVAIAETRARNDALASELAAPTPAADRLAGLRTWAANQRERVGAALDALAARTVPGTVTRRDGDRDDDPIGALKATVTAADDAAAALGEVAVESAIVGDGEGERAVDLLRVGGICAWWRDLDRDDAGPTAIRDGTLRGLPAADDAHREAILRAFARAEERAPPGVETLNAVPVDGDGR